MNHHLHLSTDISQHKMKPHIHEAELPILLSPNHQSTSFGISYKWNHTVCGFLWSECFEVEPHTVYIRPLLAFIAMLLHKTHTPRFTYPLPPAGHLGHSPSAAVTSPPRYMDITFYSPIFLFWGRGLRQGFSV